MGRDSIHIAVQLHSLIRHPKCTQIKKADLGGSRGQMVL